MPKFKTEPAELVAPLIPSGKGIPISLSSPASYAPTPSAAVHNKAPHGNSGWAGFRGPEGFVYNKR